MIRTSSRPRGSILSRAAMAAALTLGALGGGILVSSPAMAGGPAYSKPFVAAAGPLQQSVQKAKGHESDAGVADGLKKQLEAAVAAATNPDDKFAAGNLSVQVGGLLQDSALQRQGVQLMLASGKAPPETTPKLHFYAGQFAYQAKDYATARSEFQAAIAGGYKDNDVEVLLAESYFADNQTNEGLAALQAAIDHAKAAGAAVPESWYRRGLGAAYGGKQADKAAMFATELVKAYPTTKNWSAAIAVVRDLAHYASQDALDLMRLMARTNSFAEERDYIEFIQSADVRRNPGEVKAIIDQGVASGMLKPGNQFVSEAQKIAVSRIPGDRASLPGLEKDARGANATAATITGAADAFLSYGEGAKAAELYKIALGKPGVDQPVVYTRLGIAQADTGDYAGAQASFAKVNGPRKMMADLWSVYAAGKAAGH